MDIDHLQDFLIELQVSKQATRLTAMGTQKLEYKPIL